MSQSERVDGTQSFAVGCCAMVSLGVLSVGYSSADLWGPILTQQPPSVGIALCSIVFYGIVCCSVVSYSQLKRCRRQCASSDDSRFNETSLQDVHAYRAV